MYEWLSQAIQNATFAHRDDRGSLKGVLYLQGQDQPSIVR